MLSKSFVDEFVQLIKSDYTNLDFLRFVQGRGEAQNIIENHYDDVHKVMSFLDEHSDSEIETILNTDHTEYYDPDYGTLDPLCGWRIYEKKEIDDLENYLNRGDDPLTWIWRAIEDDKDQLEEDLEDVFDFINGIPSVFGIRIGANARRAWMETIKPTFPGVFHDGFPIRFSSLTIDCECEKDETVTSFSLYIPFDCCTQEFIQDFYEYVSDAFPYQWRTANYTYDTDDKLSAVNIELRNGLYIITMANQDHPIHGKSLQIMIKPTGSDAVYGVDLEIYKTFETIMAIPKYAKTTWETLYAFLPDSFKK